MADNKLKVTLVKSAHGRLANHRACVRGLGLRRTHSTAVVIDTPENREALSIAQDIIQGAQDVTQVDAEAATAMTGSQEYIESIISSKQLRERGTVKLADEQKFEIEQLILEGF